MMCLIAGDRLSNFKIGVTNRNPLENRPNAINLYVCVTRRHKMGGSERRDFKCGREGRHVVVLMEKKEFLTLCEVAVFGWDSNDRKHSRGRHMQFGFMLKMEVLCASPCP